MTFQKYPLKTQIILGLVFTPLNFFTCILFTSVLKSSLFMDMIFVYAASFFGIPCGIITGIGQGILNSLFYNRSFLYCLYAICCVTGTLLTWLIVTRHDVFSFIRLAILFFVSTVVISLEGSIIYTLFFSEKIGAIDQPTVMFLIYNLVQQGLGLQLSAFLARLPVNLFDKAIAVFGGSGIFFGIQKISKNC